MILYDWTEALWVWPHATLKLRIQASASSGRNAREESLIDLQPGLRSGETAVIFHRVVTASVQCWGPQPELTVLLVVC